MSRKVVGIDIRNHSVAAVLLSSSLREYRVDDFIHLTIPDSDGPENGLLAALETLTEKMDLSGCDAVASISANQFTFRNLKIPFGNAKKIRMVLPFELEPTLPAAMEDLVIDFHLLEGSPAGDQTELFAAAIERKQLTPYIEALASIHIDPEKLTITGMPTAMCLANQADPDEDHLFIEIDNGVGTLFMMPGGRLQLIRSFPMPAAGPSASRQLSAQVKQTLAAFHESSGFSFQPLEVVISGSGLDEAMTAEIGESLDMPVKMAALADRWDIPIEGDSEAPWNAAIMDNALALGIMEVEGLSCLNFHKGQFAAQKFISKNKSPLIKTGVLAAIVLALMLFNVLMESYTLNKQIGLLDSQMTQIFKATFPEVKQIKGGAYQHMQSLMQAAKKNPVFQAEAGPHVRSIDILKGISEKIPQSIKVNLTRLVVQPDTALITGTTDTYDSVNAIKSRLEQIQYFEKVTISSANIDRSGNEVRFTLKVEL
jgi:general secretion pathway protein L